MRLISLFHGSFDVVDRTYQNDLTKFAVPRSGTYRVGRGQCVLRPQGRSRPDILWADSRVFRRGRRSRIKRAPEKEIGLIVANLKLPPFGIPPHSRGGGCQWYRGCRTLRGLGTVRHYDRACCLQHRVFGPFEWFTVYNHPAAMANPVVWAGCLSRSGRTQILRHLPAVQPIESPKCALSCHRR